VRAIAFNSHPAVGVAYNSSLPTFLDEHPDAVDYVEMPFELIHHSTHLVEIERRKPLILHCASLSLAGSILPCEQTVGAVEHWVRRTRTPWLGEHLAFVTAERAPFEVTAGDGSHPGPYDVGYSVNPPANDETLRHVVRSVAEYERRFKVPILLENSPVYFVPPGSTMTQAELLRKVCAHSSAQLLVDLTHLYITANVMGLDPCEEVLSLPLDRVVEVHISGVDWQDGVYWDDHTKPAPDAVYEMLDLVLERSRLKAITLEYNWSTHFPPTTLLQEIARARAALAKSTRVCV
jgi:uncharacterized protein (UPF0276 family)